MSIKKVTSHPTQNESLIFERSQTGRVGYRLPKLDVEETDIELIIPAELRRDDDLNDVPEVSEVDVVRHRLVRDIVKAYANLDVELLDRSRHVSARVVHDEIQLAP